MFKKKIVVIGDGGAGKTSLLMVYKDKKFPTHYIPTVFETYGSQVKWNNKEITLELWDTAGQEDYDRLRPISYFNTDVVIICYNVQDELSIINVRQKWAPEANHFCPNAPTILVGTKIDLRNDQQIKDNKCISNSEGITLSQNIDADAFFECSAKENKNVQAIFEAAIVLSMSQSTLKRKECLFI